MGSIFSPGAWRCTAPQTSLFCGLRKSCLLGHNLKCAFHSCATWWPCLPPLISFHPHLFIGFTLAKVNDYILINPTDTFPSSYLIPQQHLTQLTAPFFLKHFSPQTSCFLGFFLLLWLLLLNLLCQLFLLYLAVKCGSSAGSCLGPLLLLPSYTLQVIYSYSLFIICMGWTPKFMSPTFLAPMFDCLTDILHSKCFKLHLSGPLSYLTKPLSPLFYFMFEIYILTENCVGVYVQFSK